MKIGIVIPTYITHQIHVDITLDTIDSLSSAHPFHIYLIDNHHTKPFEKQLAKLDTRDNITRIENPLQNNLAAAWNIGTALSLGLTPPTPVKHSSIDADIACIINNDIIAKTDTIDNLVEFSKKHTDLLLWSASEWSSRRTLKNAQQSDSWSLHPHFSFFAINKYTIDTVGWFDENLAGAYFEDNDYHTRILLAGFQAGATDSAKFYHLGSRTLIVDESNKVTIQKHYNTNRKYIQKKWGLDYHAKGFNPPAEILKDIFKTPFNNPKKSIKDW